MPVRHLEVLQSDKVATVIKLNPRAYKACAFKGRPPQDAVLALNTNYSWLRKPIGIVRDNFKSVPSIHYLGAPRPILGFDNLGKAHYNPDHKQMWTAFQAGPTLINNRVIVANSSIVRENFKPDAVRRCAHVSVGITMAGKLLVAYTHNLALIEIAKMLWDYGAEYAMKMDGGHQSMLHLADPYYEPVELGNAGFVACGLYFTPTNR